MNASMSTGGTHIYVERCVYSILGREITKHALHIHGSGQPNIYAYVRNTASRAKVCTW